MKQPCTYRLYQIKSLIYNLLSVFPICCIFGNVLQDTKDFCVQYSQALKWLQDMIKI